MSYQLGSADADGRAVGDAQLLHVVGVHGDGVDDGLVFGAVLADVDLLSLLAGATGIHDESLACHPRLRQKVGQCHFTCLLYRPGLTQTTGPGQYRRRRGAVTSDRREVLNHRA